MKIFIKYTIFFVILSLQSTRLPANQSVADSLRRLLGDASFHEKVDILNELSRSFWNESLEKSIDYAREALAIAQDTDNARGTADALNRLGNAEYMQGNHGEAIDFYLQSLEIRLEINDPRGILGSYNNLYLAYTNLGEPGTAIEYLHHAVKLSLESENQNDIARFSRMLGNASTEQHDFENAKPNLERALEIYYEFGDTLRIASSLANIGRMYQWMNIYDRALEFFLKAQMYYRAAGNRSGIASVKNNIGIIHKQLGNLDLAIRYYERSLSIYSEDGEVNRGTASLLNNIGVVWYEKEEYETALDYYSQALETYENISDSEGVAVTSNNRGLIYTRLGRYDEALESFLKSAEINKSLHLDYNLSNNFNNLGELYFTLKNYDKALEYLDLAIEIAIRINARTILTENYLFRSRLFRELDDYETALLCYELYDSYQDNIHSAEASERIAELQVRYSRERQMNELDLLHRDYDLHQLQINRQQTRMIFYGVIAFLTAIFVLTMHGMYRYKKKLTLNLRDKNLELEHAYSKLTLTEKDLQKLNNTKDKFFSIIAHDLKNPFNALLGFSETLNQNYKELTRDQIFTYIGIINKAASSLYMLLENLLIWSKCQTGNIIYKPEQFNLLGLTEIEINSAGVSSGSKSIDVLVKIDPGINVFADRNSMAMVLRNLINNAIKFTHRGGKIIIAADEKADQVEVSVTDNGIGISPSEQKKLFSLDYNITSPGTDDERGTGLGLILCREFVSQNGGELNIISEPGSGSTLIFSIPK